MAQANADNSIIYNVNTTLIDNYLLDKYFENISFLTSRNELKHIDFRTETFTDECLSTSTLTTSLQAQLNNYFQYPSNTDRQFRTTSDFNNKLLVDLTRSEFYIVDNGNVSYKFMFNSDKFETNFINKFGTFISNIYPDIINQNEINEINDTMINNSEIINAKQENFSIRQNNINMNTKLKILHYILFFIQQRELINISKIFPLLTDDWNFTIGTDRMCIFNKTNNIFTIVGCLYLSYNNLLNKGNNIFIGKNPIGNIILNIDLNNLAIDAVKCKINLNYKIDNLNELLMKCLTYLTIMFNHSFNINLLTNESKEGLLRKDINNPLNYKNLSENINFIEKKQNDIGMYVMKIIKAFDIPTNYIMFMTIPEFNDFIDTRSFKITREVLNPINSFDIIEINNMNINKFVYKPSMNIYEKNEIKYQNENMKNMTNYKKLYIIIYPEIISKDFILYNNIFKINNIFEKANYMIILNDNNKPINDIINKIIIALIFYENIEQDQNIYKSFFENANIKKLKILLVYFINKILSDIKQNNKLDELSELINIDKYKLSILVNKIHELMITAERKQQIQNENVKINIQRIIDEFLTSCSNGYETTNSLISLYKNIIKKLLSNTPLINLYEEYYEEPEKYSIPELSISTTRNTRKSTTTKSTTRKSTTRKSNNGKPGIFRRMLSSKKPSKPIEPATPIAVFKNNNGFEKINLHEGDTYKMEPDMMEPDTMVGGTKKRIYRSRKRNSVKM